MPGIVDIKLKKNNGSSLILVIIIMSVFFILCTSLGSSVVWEANNASNQEKKTQAYYIARAGAAATAQYIKSMSSADMSTMVSQLPLHSDNIAFGNGNYNITIPTITGGKLLITSTGLINNGKDSSGNAQYITDTVTVVLNNTVATATTITTAIFGKSSITLHGGTVDGDIATNSIAANSIVYYNDIITSGHKIIIPSTGNKDLVVKATETWIKPVTVVNSLNTVVSDYPMPVMPGFPSTLANMGNISINGAGSANISSDGYYNSVTIDSNTTLTIDTSTGDRTIRIKNLNMIQGKIIITGGNKVNLFVDNCTNLKGYVNSNGSSNGDKNKLLLYCNNTTPFTIGGETHIYGSVMWGTGDLTFTGSGAIIGNLISMGTSITLNGGSFLDSQVLYAPNANITLIAGAHVIGAVIGNMVSMDGGAIISLPNTPPTMPVIPGSSSSTQISYWQ